MEPSSSTNRKRERDAAQEGTASAAVGEERSQTLYIQCKHMSKPWDLLNGFLAQHRDVVGLSDLYDVVTAETGGSAAAAAAVPPPPPGPVVGAVLKRTAPIDVAYVYWSRKPYFLLEFTGPGAAERARRLLAIPQQDRVFRDMPVTISTAMSGMSVAVERKKSEELEQKGKVQPSHAAPQPSGAGKSAAAGESGRGNASSSAGGAPPPPQRPTVTSFVPRIVKR